MFKEHEVVLWGNIIVLFFIPTQIAHVVIERFSEFWLIYYYYYLYNAYYYRIKSIAYTCVHTTQGVRKHT